MSLATTVAPAAMPSTSTIPNDSPPSDGAHSTWAPVRRRIFSSSESTPSQRTEGDSGCSRRSDAVGPSPAIHSIGGAIPAFTRVARAQSIKGVEQHLESFPGLVAAEEQHGRPFGGPRLDALEPVDLDTVEQQLVPAAQGAADAVARAASETAHRTANRRASRRVTGRNAV